jgi:hypothetical protein
MDKKRSSPFPVFNHVAISMEKELLGEAGRSDILKFSNAVFGFTESNSSIRAR